MRKLISLLVVITMLFAGCKQAAPTNEATNANVESTDATKEDVKSNDKFTIVTTLFPTYSFAKEIAPNADVKLLLPPGADSHAFEPSPDDILSLQNADLVVYTSQHMEEWFERTKDAINLDDNRVVKAAEGIKLMKGHHEHHDHDDHDHDDEGDVCPACGHVHTYDPHVWTNPVLAKKMAENIYNKIVELDPSNKDEYSANFEKLSSELDELDKEFREIVKNGKRDEIFFGSRFALSYFVKEYGIDAHSVYDNCTSHAEPNPKEMADIIEEMKEEHAPVVFYEELIDPKLANQIADEVGAKAMLFHSCHNLSKEDFEAGKTYVGIMKANAEALKEALK